MKKHIFKLKVLLFTFLVLFNISSGYSQSEKPDFGDVYIVPNFHPASCGWLTDWSTERNYIVNSYLDHLDKLNEDDNYNFVLSECNNIIGIMNLRPDRMAELRQRIKEGRVELCNAFFLEPTINISGGEALVRMGIEGIRWQQKVMNVTPRFCWAIDICGAHEQMPQICKGLGLEGMVYYRSNIMNKSVYWSESPDGSRLLTLVPSFYAVIDPLFYSEKQLSKEGLESIEKTILREYNSTPKGAPILALGGSGDYSLSPKYKGNPTEFFKQWKAMHPKSEVRTTTFSTYFDALTSKINNDNIDIPILRGGTTFEFDAFWVNHRSKLLFRSNEHLLQSAEKFATIVSLVSDYEYPVKIFYNSWLQILLYMDRNTLWGSAGGMVFEDEKSWDAKDRYMWVKDHSASIQQLAGEKVFGNGNSIGFFNPTNTRRTTPVALWLPEGKTLAQYTCEALPNGLTLCDIPFNTMEIRSADLVSSTNHLPQAIVLPDQIETGFYTVSINSKTGAISSLKLKSNGQELLNGNANIIVLESYTENSPGDQLESREERKKVMSSDEFTPSITVKEGSLSTTVIVENKFYGGNSMRRLMRFYKNSPRIDFETELNDIPDLHVAMAEFPLRESPLEIRKGIPYGFAHTAWSKPNENLHGPSAKIQPAVRWSSYSLEDGSGLAILDKGNTGREITGNIPVIYLINATSTYWKLPNSWLTGAGKHHFEYAIVPYQDWYDSHIPEMAWEYNSPVTVLENCEKTESRSFVETSDNVIIESMRRDGSDIELRLVESKGKEGICNIKIDLPHISARLTNFLGENAKPLDGNGAYSFPIKNQQIVTIRLKTEASVGEAEPLLKWDELVPEHKHESLNKYLEGKKGHPPRFFDNN